MTRPGLTGIYDFHLAFVARENAPIPQEQAAPEITSEAATPAPDLVQAVEKQLGMRMESRKIPVESIVIDHLDKVPTDNL